MTSHAIATIHPQDPGYDDARLGFQAHAPHRPAAVVRARTAADVAAAVAVAVAVARDEGRPVCVQATGHGLGTTHPGALLIDTRRLDAVAVDPGARTARIEAGATWGAVTAAAAPHGLAGLSGSAATVGAAGYLVHGGLSLLGREFGWAADHVRAFEVVTADAALRRVEIPRGPGVPSTTLDPRCEGRTSGDPATELAWALRGGGGSFAIVTAVEIDLVPVASVFGGSLFFPVDGAAETVTGWRDWARTIPDAASTSLAVIPFPDVDGPPPPLRGRTAIAIRVIFNGSDADGDALVAPLRALGTPIIDGLGRVRWAENATIHRDPDGPAGSLSANLALRDLDDRAIAAALATVAPDEAGLRRVVELRRLGGALTEPSPRQGPTRRDAEWSAGTVTVLGRGHGPDAPASTVASAAARDAVFRDHLAHLKVGRLANFLFDEARRPEAVRESYAPQDWARLTAARELLDPGGVFLASAPIR